MIKQIVNLTKLQLINLYGFNVFRFTKDKKEKKVKLFLAVMYVLLALMMFGYVGAMSYGYIYIGLSDIIPAYLIMIASMVILMFSIFKAGNMIFQRNAYEILSSLPISQTAVVVSRFIRLYIENLILAVGTLLPGMVVYGMFLRPDVSFYLIGLLVMLFIPLLPITVSVFVGTLITGISSRMKHKSLISTGLSILLLVVMMLFSSQMSSMEGEVDLDKLKDLSEMVLAAIKGIYPPAAWLGEAMVTGNYGICFLAMAGGMFMVTAVIALVSVNYHSISRQLYSTSAKHDYQMENLKKTSVLGALYKREWKRYLSSSVYVTNTIMSPIMALLFSVMLLVLGEEQLQIYLELPIDIRGCIPFLVASIFCMMPTTCTSISLEGKEWWIVKSLPISMKDLLDSKILLNLSLAAPFWIVSEAILAMALRPNLLEMLWLLVIPAVMILFSSVYGITVNLKMPVFNWENEVSIVKQSASAFFGGIGGLLIVLISMIPVILLPAEFVNVWKVIVCVIMVALSAIMYKRNCKIIL